MIANNEKALKINLINYLNRKLFQSLEQQRKEKKGSVEAGL